jgi:hypothetical protein
MYYSHVRLNKEIDFYFLTEIYFHHVPCLINVGISSLARLHAYADKYFMSFLISNSAGT